MELKALLLKYKANKNPKDKRLKFCFVMISSMVTNRTSYALAGNKRLILSSKSCWKLSIGMYAINVNKKIIAGKSAKKKLKARDDARNIRSASNKLSKKNFPTSNRDLPLNPGKE